MVRRLNSLIIIAMVACAAAADQPPSDQNKNSGASSKPSARLDAKETLDESSEKAVLEFVAEHQPELADLLNFMKKKKSKDYNEAMRESRKVRDRLLSIRDRDPEMYDVELGIWKNSAQIRLLAAAASAKSSKLSEEEHARLEQLVRRENELNIQRLNLEKARFEARLNQVNQQLTRRQEQADSMVAKSLKAWENRIERSGAKAKKTDP